MSNVLHILAKDLRRLWPLVAAWWGALAYGLYATWPQRQTMAPEGAVPTELMNLAVIAICGLVVQQDSGSTAHADWRIRPLSSTAILSSKVLFVFGFLVIPAVMIQALALYAWGLQGGDMPIALFETGMPLVSLALVAVALAALTPSFAAFVLATLVGAMVLAMAEGLLFGQFEAYLRTITAAASTALVLKWTVMAMVAITVAVVQYRTRRLTATLGLIILGLVLTVATRFTGLDFINPSLAASSGPAEPRIERFDPQAGWSIQGNDPAGEEPEHRVLVPLHVVGLEPGVELAGEFLESEIRLADGTQLTHRGENYLSAGTALTDLLSPARLINAQPVPTLSQVLTLKESEFQQLRHQSAEVEANAYFSANRYEVAGSLPLEPGAHVHRRGAWVRMTQVEWHDGVLSVDLARFGFQLTLNPAELRTPVFVLLNAKKGEAVLSGTSSSAISSHALVLQRPRILIGEQGIRFGQSDGLRLSQDWLADAKLLWIQRTRAGRIEIPVRLELDALDQYESLQN